MYRRLIIFCIFLMFVCPVFAESEGLPFSRSLFLSPWSSSSDPVIGTHLCTGSGYFRSSPYTEGEWTTYWNAACDDLQNMHVDSVRIIVGTNYFQAKRTNDPSLDPRYQWYSGNGYLNWTIDTAHAHGISVILWQGINHNKAGYDYVSGVNGVGNQVKLRNDANSNPTLTVKSILLDPNAVDMRARYTDLIGYALSVTPELDGIAYEEVLTHYTSTMPSYGDDSVAAYIEKYGYDPLTVYETTQIRLDMLEINEIGWNTYMAELKITVDGNTTKSYPDFVIGANSLARVYTPTTRYYGINVTNWSQNGYIDYYGLQDASMTLADTKYYVEYMKETWPDIASYPIIYGKVLADPAYEIYREYFFDQILNVMVYGGDLQEIFTYPTVKYSYEGVTIRQFLIDNPPPTPTHNTTQEQTESPITNPDVSFCNEIKKTTPDGIYSSYRGDAYYFGFGTSYSSSSAYRTLEHDNTAIPENVTEAIRTYTLMGKHTLFTEGNITINLFNASNATGYTNWSTNYTSWNNQTNNTPWPTAGGVWHDANGDYMGSVPIATITVNATDPIGTTYSPNITSYILNATDGGVNLILISDSEGVANKYIWFYGTTHTNSSLIPYTTFSPLGYNAPNITTQWNNITGDDELIIEFQLPGRIEFGATANQTVDLWTWSVDNVIKNETSSNFTSQIFSDGKHTVSVYCSNNSITSSTVSWIVNVTGMIVHQPGTPENITVETGIQFINISWDTNKTVENVVDTYLILDEDTGQLFYTNDLHYNLTSLSAKEYNLTLHAQNNTNTTTRSEGYNFQAYPSINTTDNQDYYNYSANPGETITVWVRFYNETYGTYSEWVSENVTLPAGDADTLFEYWNSVAWIEDEAQYYLWFTCFWYCAECANEEQSDSQATLKITNNGSASGTPKMKLNESAPAGIRIFVDDDNTFSGAVELTDTYQAVGIALAPGVNGTYWAWANLTGAEVWDFETYAIVE